MIHKHRVYAYVTESENDKLLCQRLNFKLKTIQSLSMLDTFFHSSLTHTLSPLHTWCKKWIYFTKKCWYYITWTFIVFVVAHAHKYVHAMRNFHCMCFASSTWVPKIVLSNKLEQKKNTHTLTVWIFFHQLLKVTFLSFY